MPTLVPALGSEGGQAQTTGGNSISLSSVEHAAGLLGAWELTGREQFVLSPQSPGEVGAVF